MSYLSKILSEIMMHFEEKIGYEKGLMSQSNMLLQLVEEDALAVDIAKTKLESLKDLLPPDFYAKIIKKLN